MGFPATNIIPADAYPLGKRRMASLRNFAKDTIDDLASPQNSRYVENIMVAMANSRRELLEIKAVPGIAAYAKSEAAENDLTIDIVADFNAVIAAIEPVITEVHSTFPKNAANFWLSYTVDLAALLSANPPVESKQYRSFTAAQLSPLRTLVIVVRDSIS